MAGQGRAYRDVGGFFVANFADDEGLRVLAQEMAGGLGEIQPAGFVHFGLHDAGDDLFHRIFNGDNMASARFGQGAKTGVNGGGLAAASRPGEEQHAGRLAQKMI